MSTQGGGAEPDERGPDKTAPGAAAVTPMGEVELRELRFAGDGTVPNNPDPPDLLMRGAIAPGASAEAIAVRLAASGWGGTWVWRVFPYHHYHPNAHEALAVAAGRAELTLGGPGVGRAARRTGGRARRGRPLAAGRHGPPPARGERGLRGRGRLPAGVGGQG